MGACIYCTSPLYPSTSTSKLQGRFRGIRAPGVALVRSPRFEGHGEDRSRKYEVHMGAMESPPE
jgi:hypothetical protein